MLGAFAVAGRVGERSVRHGNGGIVFLDAATHLREEFCAQPLDIGHRRGGVGVLGLEIGADVGRQHRGVVHHLLPVVGAQPGVVVGPRETVGDGGQRPARRGRRVGDVIRDCHGSQLSTSFSRPI